MSLKRPLSPEAKYLVELDYAQVELRVLARLTGKPRWLAFKLKLTRWVTCIRKLLTRKHSNIYLVRRPNGN